MPQNDVFQYEHHLITNEMIDIFEKYINDNGIRTAEMPMYKFNIFTKVFWKNHFNIELVIHEDDVSPPRRSARLANLKK